MSKCEVANTIIQQMGGFGRLIAMVNARQFLADETSVAFLFSGCRKANKCRVELTPADLYKMQIGKVNRNTGEWVSVYEEDGLYWDMLKPEFEQTTGLYLSF